MMVLNTLQKSIGNGDSMTFKQYRNKQTGEIIETVELDYIQGYVPSFKKPLRVILNKDTGKGFCGSPNNEEFLIEKDEFESTFEEVK